MSELPSAGEVRTYSLKEANALVPDVREHVSSLREAVTRLQFAKGQVADLEERWSETIGDGGTQEGEEYDELLDELEESSAVVEGELAWFEEHGIEVKDPLVGLVDFYHERGGELVYLCWQHGEEGIGWWHELTDGFAGRRPVEEL